ncbi:MAG: hypothetical protein H7232_01470 [Aeromicrobium sp.]|nr:hypothetical protein [Burkholderiales bacterium]
MAIKNYLSNTGSWAKNTAFVAMFSVMGALLASCGGGGAASTVPVVPVVPPPPPVIALAVLPSAADVFADLPTDISISGGTPPYTAGSSNIVLVPSPAVTGSAATGFKVTILAKSANVDAPVTVTIRDSLGATANIALNVKATTLNNAVSVTPLSPTGTGCGTGICSGGDARVVVTAVLNGIKLTNRPIRFDVFQGDFRFVTPGTNALVTSIVVNTDENGEAVVRMTVLVTAPTQVATLSSTDTVSGLVRRTNFNIVQQTNGAGILSILPSGTTTFTGGKPAVGQPAQCPFGGVVDHYIYGGTPPYIVVSPLPQYLSVFPSIVTTNGGSYRVSQSGCGTSTLIVTDALNRAIESPSVASVVGPAGDAPPPTVPPTIAVTPTTLTVGCGQTGTASVSGSGTFTATVSTAGVPAGSFTVTPTAGTIPGTISFTRNNGVAAASATSIVVNITGATVVPVTITVPANCP